ncbi:MAG: hypothetical protein LBP91_05730 [Coriobacteriales bacterium]|jgi:hypothetical protein|nr:hypothetical protein [Coriobacteriales bacterium]
MTDDTTAEAVALDENDNLDRVLLYALDEAAEKLTQNGELEPFTVVLQDENLFVETHPGENAEECFDSAVKTVRLIAHVMDAYVFAYDGFIQTDSGRRDAIIAERGTPNDDLARAFALLYTLDEQGDGSLTFEEGIYDLGLATSLLSDADEDDDEFVQLDELEELDDSEELYQLDELED